SRLLVSLVRPIRLIHRLLFSTSYDPLLFFSTKIRTLDDLSSENHQINQSLSSLSRVIQVQVLPKPQTALQERRDRLFSLTCLRLALPTVTTPPSAYVKSYL